MGTSQRAMGSRRDVQMGGDPKSTREEGPAQGQTPRENHGAPNGGSRMGGDIEMGKSRKSGAASMRSRVSADEVHINHPSHLSSVECASTEVHDHA